MLMLPEGCIHIKGSYENMDENVDVEVGVVIKLALRMPWWF